MMVGKTLQWIATILVLSGLSGGGYAYWFYTHCDEELKAEFERIVAKRLPNAELKIRTCSFDFSRRAHFYDVKLYAKGLSEPLARIAEIIITIDAEKLSEEHRIDVRSVRFLRPDLRVLRNAEGEWNWQKLLPIREAEDASPEFTFEDLQVALKITQPGGNLLAFHIQQGEVRLVPSARRQFTAQAGGRLPGLGDFRLNGGFDIDKRTWTVQGRTDGQAPIAEIVDSLGPVFPELAQRLADFENSLTAASPDRTASTAVDSPSRRSVKPSLTGQVEIEFALGRPTADGHLTYSASAAFSQGEMEHPLLPFPLHGVSGKIDLDKNRLRLQGIQARNGGTQFVMNGNLNLPNPTAGNRIDVKIQDLPLDQRLQAALPESMQSLYDSIRPSGHIDAAGTLVRSGDGKWKPRGWVVTHKHTAVCAKSFPYPVTDIVGTAVQQGESMKIDLRGRAGERPIRLTGTVLHPGPQSDGSYVLELSRLPINETLINAAAAMPAFHRTLDALRLRGLLDVKCRFHRVALPDGEPQIDWQLAARLNEGSIEYEHFPYRIADLHGMVRFDSRRGEWDFSELRGNHGSAQLRGTATFIKTSPHDAGELNLEVFAEEAPLDNDLARALPPATQRLWDLIGPTGKLRTQIQLKWTPGTKPVISIPEARVTDGAFEVKSFPYSLDHVTARFALGRDPKTSNDRIAILAFEGQHDEMVVRTGRNDKQAESFILCPAPGDPIGEWRVRLERLTVQDLIPDRALRHALPPGLRKMMQSLNPQGKVSLRGMMDLRGTQRPSDPITAAWDIESIVTGATLVTGVELRNVHGSVHSSGTWDGVNIAMKGNVSLDHVEVWHHHFSNVTGPFEMQNQDLTVGSQEAFRPMAAGERERAIPAQSRLTARAVGGTFFLDAQVHLNAEKTTYRVKSAMSNASLDQYAQIYLRGMPSLSGVMRGWLELSGSSPDPRAAVGSGELEIAPAALYELPIFIQIFKTFSGAKYDKTAFKRALAKFNLGNRMVDFREIDLVGDALNLRGRGTASFEGPLHLEFYSMMARTPLQIPVVSDLMGLATKGWVGVSVTGTVQNPRAMYRSLPVLDDRLRQFLGALSPRPLTPQLTPPPWMPAFPTLTPPRPQSASVFP